MPAQRVAARLRAVPPADAVEQPIALGLRVDTKAPQWLPRGARAIFRRQLKATNTHQPKWIQEPDLPLLAAFAFSEWTYIEAVRDVARRGILVPGRSSADVARGPDGLVKNRSLAIAREASAEMRRLAVELGFSPRARHGLDLGAPEDPYDPLWD